MLFENIVVCILLYVGIIYRVLYNSDVLVRKYTYYNILIHTYIYMQSGLPTIKRYIPADVRIGI